MKIASLKVKVSNLNHNYKSMGILKFLKSGIFKKIALYGVIWIIFLYLLVIAYSNIFERDKLAIDEYNFEQLNKVKPILETISKKSRKFNTLKEFNDIYKTGIKPKKNCYYIRNYNGDYSYIFWFQIESIMYRLLYFWRNYAYPKYDLQYSRICVWGLWCYDDNMDWYEYIISHPCEDD